jgi:hypothetical protein
MERHAIKAAGARQHVSIVHPLDTHTLLTHELFKGGIQVRHEGLAGDEVCVSRRIGGMRRRP